MSLDGQKIIFLSHESSRTGAVRFLLHLIGWVKANTTAEIRILTRHGGPWLDEFRALGPTFRLDREEVPREWLEGAALLYSNTVTNGRYVEEFGRCGIPVITHVHELHHEFRLAGVENGARLLTGTTHFVACSEVVGEMLRERCGVDSERISVVAEMIVVGDVLERAGARLQGDVRENLGVGETDFLVGGSGVASWRKGADLFVQMAAACTRDEERGHEGRRLRYLWIGNLEKSPELRQIEHDLERLGLGERIQFTGDLENPFPYMQALDLFCLPSREDPFPLVMLEAGALGKPTLAFADSGGASEYCQLGGGKTVPYLDVTAMRRVCLEAAAAESGLVWEGVKSGEALRAMVSANFDVEVLARRLWGVIERVAGAAAVGSNGSGVPRIQSLEGRECPGRISWGGSDDLLQVPVEFSTVPGRERQVTISLGPANLAGKKLRFRVSLMEGFGMQRLKELRLVDSTSGVLVKDYLIDRGEGLEVPTAMVRVPGEGEEVVLLWFTGRAEFTTPGVKVDTLPGEFELRLRYIVDCDIGEELAALLQRDASGRGKAGPRWQRLLRVFQDRE
ncbi:MAG: glycosyltransferase family 4 protein [Verrucomicrobiota bacterium]